MGSIHRIGLSLLLHVSSIELVIASPTGDANVSLAIGVTVQLMDYIGCVESLDGVGVGR